MEASRIRRLLTFILCLIVLSISFISHGSQIPLGLDWRQNFFIQEYWVGDELEFCVSNARPTPEVLEVSHWMPGQKEVGRLILSETFLSGQARCISAASAKSNRYLKFMLKSGSVLGLLRNSAKPPKFNDGIIQGAMSSGLNGFCRTVGAVVGGANKLHTANQDFFLDMYIPVDQEIHDIEIVREAEGLKALVPKKATVNSLMVDVSDSRIYVDAVGAGLQDGAQVNHIRLHYNAPDVSELSMYQVSFKLLGGSARVGCLVRGVLISP